MWGFDDGGANDAKPGEEESDGSQKSDWGEGEGSESMESEEEWEEDPVVEALRSWYMHT